MDINIEIGSKEGVAGVIDWPGWTRNSRDEAGALQTLIDYGQRYAPAIESAGLEFRPAAAISSLNIIERLPGNATTDFGGLGLLPSGDLRLFDTAELRRSTALLSAAWDTFVGKSAVAFFHTGSHVALDRPHMEDRRPMPIKSVPGPPE